MKPVDIYVSTDIEADGEVPGKNSMLSIGSAAYLAIVHQISVLNDYIDLARKKL